MCQVRNLITNKLILKDDEEGKSPLERSVSPLIKFANLQDITID